MYNRDMFYEQFAEQLQINSTGVLILLVWALASIGIGAFFWIRLQKKEQKAFFQMTFFWGIINLFIAGLSAWYLASLDPESLDLKTIIYTGFNLEKLLLFNAGLDIAYVAIGSFLAERGSHTKSPLLSGYGKALWIQGGFLLIYDIVFYIINTTYNQAYSFYILF